MQTAEGIFLRQTGGKGYFARVAVEVEASAPVADIRLALSGCGWNPQGDPHEPDTVSHADWVAGAKSGAVYAPRVAGRSGCSVTIRRILGSYTDTNPTTVAAAAADAVWKVLNFVPSETIRQHIESVALRSWNAELGAILAFDD